MSTFIEMVNRIAAELRRSNIETNIKNAINDAIDEASKTRFWFNEFEWTFTTSNDTEWYADINGTMELDFAYRLFGSQQKEYLQIINDRSMDWLNNDGSRQLGIPRQLSYWDGGFRLEPIPNGEHFLFIKGYGKLTPNPLVADNATNSWLNEGERYIRALAKAYLLRDVVRDYGEAATLEAVAEDIKNELLATTALKQSTGCIESTQF